MAQAYRKKMIANILNERGSALMMAYFVIAAFLILGSAFLIMSTNDSRRSAIQQYTEQALYVAEAGLEQVLYELRQEFETGDGSWLDDVTIDGNDYTANTSAFYEVYSQESFPTGAYTHAYSPAGTNHYTVSLRNIAGEEDMWIRSTGQVDNVTQTLQMYVKIVNVSPWNNAIFGGAGSSGTMVNGNVNIYGSVHILGDGLDPGDNAIDLGGTAELVGNNYNVGPQGMSTDLEAKVPPLPTTEFNEETVETLSAELRVKNGIVSLGGNSTVGQDDSPGGSPQVKETVDGAYVTDGYGGSKGASSVYSDNGTNEAYDLGDAVSFPSLNDPHPLDPSGDYYDYFNNNGLVLTTELSDIDFGETVSEGNCATNCIVVNADGTIQVEGIIYVSGNNEMKLENGDFEYTGRGTILVTGDVTIDANLVTAGDDSFPTNIMGIMSSSDIKLGTSSQKDVMGLFYAENEIETDFQTDLVGTILTNYFDITNQVPSIFQVPLSEADLPPGIIAADTVWYMNQVSWQKCDSHTATCGGVN